MLLPSERASLRRLLLLHLLPALRGHEAAGGPEGAAAVLTACACAGVAAAEELPRRQLAALMAAAGDPFEMAPATVGALLPALVATGLRPGPRWLSAAAAALHFRRRDASRRDVVGALSALAALRHAPPAAAIADLLRGLASGRENVARLSAGELVALLSALRGLGYRPPRTWARVFMEASVAKLPQMTAPQHAALLRGLAWAGAAPTPQWSREFLRRSWRVLPGAAPGPLAEVLHFALLLRMQPPARWADACLSLLREGQRDALTQRRGLAGQRRRQQQQQGEGLEATAGGAAAEQGGEQQSPSPPPLRAAAAAGLAPLMTPHQVALAVHALALLPPSTQVAAGHRRWLRGAVVMLQPAAAALPLKDLSYLLYAVGRLKMEVPRRWLCACLEQLHMRVQEQQQQLPSAAAVETDAAAAPVAPPLRAAAVAAAQAPQADAAELAAVLSLMAHFAAAAQPGWVADALRAVAARRRELSDEALTHALVSCAALGLAPATAQQQQQQQQAEAAPGEAAGALQQAIRLCMGTDAAQLLQLLRGRLQAHAVRQDAVSLSRATRLLQSHRQRGFPSWYGALLEEAGGALASCAGGTQMGDQPARRLARGPRDQTEY